MSAAPKININHPFMDRLVVLSFANGVVEALKTMSDISAEFEKPFAALNWRSPSDVSVYLTLNSDSYKGRLVFHFPIGVAKAIIEKITGSEVQEDSDDVLDGVGEISNMFYGAAKTKLNTSGFNLTMSIPKPCWTKSLPQPMSDSTCMLIPFKVLNEMCYVEIVLF